MILTVLLASCTSQRKLATAFITEQTDIHVLLLPPQVILKKYYPVHPDSLAAREYDPLNLEASQFIKDAKDSVLLGLFMSSLRKNLEAFDVKVYGPGDMEPFLNLDSLAYVFSVAQIEIMEYLNEEVQYAVLDTTVYEVGFEKVNLVHSQWFEFTELNHPEQPMQVLYSAQYTGDIFDGKFRHNILTGEMNYEFQPYRVRFADLYQLSDFAGSKNAQFIFDFLLNKYVDDHTKKSRRMVDYLQYDRDQHIIRRAYDDRFIRINLPLED
jgi:hypothetical protein